MLVPTGALILTRYVEIDAVKLACRERMSMGDLEVAYRKIVQLGEHEQWPCPVGHWEDNRFVITDGRHQFVAALMLGRTHILVAWIVGP